MRRRLGVASLLVCFFGCGDNQHVALEDLAGREIQAACERAVRCHAQSDVDTCVALIPAKDIILPPFVILGQDPGIPPAVANGKATFHAEHADGCLAALENLDCDVTTESVRVVPDECIAMFEGQVAEGDACEFDGECETGRCLENNCDDDFVCCLGMCIAPAHSVADGDPCTYDTDCSADSFCTGTGCAPLLLEGNHCSLSADCGFGLQCVGLSPTSSASCKVPPKLGEPCPDHACSGIGTICSSDGMCVELGHLGDGCEHDRDCEHELVCDPSLHCALPPSIGEDCATACESGSWCHLGSDTMMGKCEADFDDDTFCESNLQCLSGFCAEGEFSAKCIDPLVCF